MFVLVSLGAFSVGFDFKYWSQNEDDPYYVKKKYDDLKQEILHYEHLNIRLYKAQIIPKAQQYRQSPLVKSIEANHWMGQAYGIPHETVISIELLTCIILYTDFDALSTAFSSTFRKLEPFETLNSVKMRNQKYYWFAKGLKEVIAVYGQSYGNGSGIGLLSPLYGPFFCGMSYVMMMPAFDIKIFGPTSTSVHQEVAIKFSGEHGMIIQFDNHKGTGTRVSVFDVSIISRYGSEDER